MTHIRYFAPDRYFIPAPRNSEMVVLPTEIKTAYMSHKIPRLINSIQSRINAMDIQADINKLDGISPSGEIIWSQDRKKFIKLLKYAKRSTYAPRSNRLVINHLKEPNILNHRKYAKIGREFREYGTLKQQCYDTFGHFNSKNSNNADLIHLKILEMLHQQTALSRQNNHQKRLAYAICDAVSKGYFIIFNTLTATNDAMASGVFYDRKTVKAYLRKIKRDSPGAKHFGVIEGQGADGRLHYHFIHILPTLPEDSYDPNIGRHNPNHNELQSFKKYWNAGISAPLMLRFGAGDAFGQANYRWPNYPNTKKGKPHPQAGQPIQRTDPHTAGKYLTKYLLKAYTQPKGDFKWRTMISRNLGIQPLIQLLKPLNSFQLMEVIVAGNLPKSLNLLNKKIPLQLLRSQAAKQWIKNNLSSSNPLRGQILSAISRLRAQPSLLKRLNDSSMKKPKLNYQNITFIAMENSLSMDTFKILLTGITQLNNEWGVKS